VSDLVDAFLAHHLRLYPVDATFIGAAGHDHRLPPLDADEERAGIAALRHQLAVTPESDAPGGRLDRRFIVAELARASAALDTRPRFANPAWYAGEAAFAVVSLLLPQSAPVNRAALLARLESIPDFLASARARLGAGTASQGWTRRAQREARAMAGFLDGDLRLHPAWQAEWEPPAAAAAAAFGDFAAALDTLPDADPIAGAAYIDLMLRTVHGFAFDADEALQRAEAAYARLGEELAAMAARLEPARSAPDQLAALAAIGPEADAVPAAYRDWHRRAMADARHLVTPAEDYGLDFPLMAPAFRGASRALYFLAYRSPPAARPGAGSVYWVPAPPEGDTAAYRRGLNLATIKSVHAVHHGSIGHHTQNARARAAASRIARIAGTDAASGLTLPSAGTMVEGWACYAQLLMLECPGFHTPAEALLEKQQERRNAASVLVDIRLHDGRWSAADAARFYREAGFAPERIEGELVRNTIFPGSRLMYWLGVEAIRDLRLRWRGDPRSFHDTLLSFGHAPIAWIGEEMERAGMLG